MTPRIPQNIFNWLADWILTMPPRDPSDRHVELALAIRQVNRLSPLKSSKNCVDFIEHRLSLACHSLLESGGRGLR
jgi:hypothetical protein